MRVVLLAALALACGGERGAPRERGAGTAGGEVRGGAAFDTSRSTSTGLWDVPTVQNRLEHAGLAPRRADARVRVPYLSVAGVAFALGRSELQVFVYPDSAARARDTGRLDPKAVAPAGARTPWSMAPTLIVSNNLAAVLLSQDERQIERVQDALTAGLPAPKRK
jgi:hypothetical protein